MLALGAQAAGLLSKQLVVRAGTVGIAFAGRRSVGLLARSTGNSVGQTVVPRAVWFQAAQLSTGRRGVVLRSEKDREPVIKTEKDEKPVIKTEKDEKPVIKTDERKPTLMEKIKHEAQHYWNGTKLFAKEMKISSRLVSKVAWGGRLTRREQRQLRRTFSDTVRLVPFLLFVVIPFAELLLPVALKLFPGMLPSTYESQALADKKREKTQNVRNEMSRYLKETIAEMNGQRAGTGEAADTGAFLSKIRTSGEEVSTQDLLRVAHIFEDDLTLDNLTRPQLVSICRFMGVNAFGTDTYLRYQITNRMRYIRADDKMIGAEGIASLSVPELQSACQSRGMRTIGVSPARMRDELAQWIELHLEHNIPSTLLILSRIIAAGEPISHMQQFNADALQATINSLPENLVNEATLRLAEVSGTATAKQKLEVLEEQEELIEDEDAEAKEEKAKAEDKKPKAEEKKTKAEEKAKAEEKSKAEDKEKLS
ncbi:LETM1 domain-containing protein ylh47 [Coemansia erecta]|nr:LETM1 domain-containing protein ylh47 [Coemansia erecta]